MLNWCQHVFIESSTIHDKKILKHASTAFRLPKLRDNVKAQQDVQNVCYIGDVTFGVKRI